MKQIKYTLLLLISVLFIGSCDYLDIVPDEKPTEEDAFEDLLALQRYMYSCYAYLPQSNNGSGSLDFMTGDEVVTAFEHETFAAFPKGNYTSARPVISYWDTIFSGIKQCYRLINNIDKVPGVTSEIRKDYIAQANFLIAYYHFLMIRCYGPVIIIDSEPDMLTPPAHYKSRSKLDDCVQFTVDLFDKAADNLPSDRPVVEYGLATNVAAKSLKAKLLTYVASPLFNGNSEFYANFKSKTGELLMPLAYDENKWVIAKAALKEAINLAHEEGHALYENDEYNAGNLEPVDPIQHRLRNNIIEAGNTEIIWAETRNAGPYSLQNKSVPYADGGSAWNGVAPTMAMLERFYTKNGLPLSEDPEYIEDEKFKVVTIGEEYENMADVGNRTFKFNLDREPRFYAWIAFQGGFYEIMSAETNGIYNNDPSYKKYSSKRGKAKLVCDFVLGGNCSRGTVGKLRNNNYSPTGYLNKKGVNPAYIKKKTGAQGPIEHPWPIIRLADLYLLYAEACVETNDLDVAKEYLNKVRVRAGIPTVEESWAIAGKSLTKDKMREVVRQERMIEFYLENQNFWDFRRWLIAEQYFNVKAKGMNITAGSLEDFAKETEVVFERKFSAPTQYLLPLPQGDINKNEKLVNNPGY